MVHDNLNQLVSHLYTLTHSHPGLICLYFIPATEVRMALHWQAVGDFDVHEAQAFINYASSCLRAQIQQWMLLLAGGSLSRAQQEKYLDFVLEELVSLSGASALFTGSLN